jgi:hypothetical protein
MRPGARRRRPCRAVPAPRRMHAPGAAPIAGRRRAAEAPEPRRRQSEAPREWGDIGPPPTANPARCAPPARYPERAGRRRLLSCETCLQRPACRTRRPEAFSETARNVRSSTMPVGDGPGGLQNPVRTGHDVLAAQQPQDAPRATGQWPPGWGATGPRFRHLAGCRLATITPLGHDCATGHSPPGHPATWPLATHRLPGCLPLPARVKGAGDRVTSRLRRC